MTRQTRTITLVGVGVVVGAALIPIVKKRDTKEFGDFRTKLRVLGAYDEIVSSEATKTTATRGP